MGSAMTDSMTLWHALTVYACCSLFCAAISIQIAKMIVREEWEPQTNLDFIVVLSIFLIAAPILLVVVASNPPRK